MVMDRRVDDGKPVNFFGKDKPSTILPARLAIKFDLDWNGDPRKWDPYNSTANNAELDRMMTQMTAVREQIGYTMDLCVDMHGNYDLTTGVRAAKMLEPIRLMWLEEPIPAENLEGVRSNNFE